MAEQQEDPAVSLEAEMVANIPSRAEEKTILGFISDRQLSILSVGGGLSVSVYIGLMLILRLFGLGTITRILISLLIAAIIMTPFLYLAFKRIYSDSVNPIVLHYAYVQRQIDRQWVAECGEYINYHTNHVVNDDPGVFISDETTAGWREREVPDEEGSD